MAMHCTPSRNGKHCRIQQHACHVLPAGCSCTHLTRFLEEKLMDEAGASQALPQAPGGMDFATAAAR